jgi:ABC-type transporter Mla subunit MlaD
VNILVAFFVGLSVLVVLFVVVILLAGFRPQRGSRAARQRFRGTGGVGDGSGGTSP